MLDIQTPEAKAKFAQVNHGVSRITYDHSRVTGEPILVKQYN
jgi:hypothetical protein